MQPGSFGAAQDNVDVECDLSQEAIYLLANSFRTLP